MEENRTFISKRLKDQVIQKKIADLMDDLDLGKKRILEHLKKVLDNPQKEENLLRAVDMAANFHGMKTPEKILVDDNPYEEMSNADLKAHFAELLEIIGEESSP